MENTENILFISVAVIAVFSMFSIIFSKFTSSFSLSSISFVIISESWSIEEELFSLYSTVSVNSISIPLLSTSKNSNCCKLTSEISFKLLVNIISNGNESSIYFSFSTFSLLTIHCKHFLIWSP